MKRGAVDSTYYTQVNMVRTIEQILGLPPMNQHDLVAEPMRSLFTDTPDYTPYAALPNNIPLDQLTPTPTSATAAVKTAWERLSADFKLPYPGDGVVLFPNQVKQQRG